MTSQPRQSDNEILKRREIQRRQRMSSQGRVIVSALESGGHEFEPRHFQATFDLGLHRKQKLPASVKANFAKLYF